jgi:hypothetical protein
MPELQQNLPCLSCQAPESLDVKFAIGQDMFRNGANLSPSGLPLQCCKIRIVVDIPSKSSAAPTTGLFHGGRRSGGWPWNRPPPLRR